MADVWYTISYLEPTTPTDLVLSELYWLPRKVTHLRIFCISAGVINPSGIRHIAEALEGLREQGITIRVIAYCVLMDEALRVLQAASAGQRIVLKDTPLAMTIPALKKTPTSSLVTIMRQTLEDIVDLKLPLDREFLAGQLSMMRKYEDILLTYVPVNRKTVRIWCEQPYVSQDVEWVRNNWLERTMSEFKIIWGIVTSPITCTWVNEDILQFGLADKVCSWSEAFDDYA